MKYFDLLIFSGVTYISLRDGCDSGLEADDDCPGGLFFFVGLGPNMASMILLDSSLVVVEVSMPTPMLASSRWKAWSRIKESNGDTTSVIPGLSNAGN